MLPAHVYLVMGANIAIQVPCARADDDALARSSCWRLITDMPISSNYSFSMEPTRIVQMIEVKALWLVPSSRTRML